MGEYIPLPPDKGGSGPGRTKGTIFALVALAFVVLMVVFLPPARIFLAISIPIGIVCAVILYFVNRRPVKLPDDENKRPLGLS
jgi:asparagine N-glycosylation enzyme membrane subunit Stt3